MMKEAWIFKGNILFMRYHEGDGCNGEAELKPNLLKGAFGEDDVWIFPTPLSSYSTPIIGKETDRVIIKYEKCEPPKMESFDIEQSW